MAQLKGKVIMVNDTEANKTAVIEITPAVPAKDGNAAVPAKRLSISTNEHAVLDEVKRGQMVDITIVAG